MAPQSVVLTMMDLMSFVIPGRRISLLDCVASFLTFTTWYVGISQFLSRLGMGKTMEAASVLQNRVAMVHKCCSAALQHSSIP